MGKPFLAIEEQIELLERRGVSRTKGERCALMREGYYSIINGYKGPFLEPIVTKDDLSDHYKGNTSFDDIFALFTFDRSLRALTFRNLIKAEATARTAIAYTFASAHRGKMRIFCKRVIARIRNTANTTGAIIHMPTN